MNVLKERVIGLAILSIASEGAKYLNFEKIMEISPNKKRGKCSFVLFGLVSIIS